MGNKVIQIDKLQGISQQEVPALQQQYGRNRLQSAADHRFLHIIKDVFREPMFIMLVIACSLYFILGEISEGIMMAVAIGIVFTISLYQEIKSSRAIKALRQLTEPMVVVIRDGKEQLINSMELVPGDMIVLEEGMSIPADARVLQQNDLSINESVITGESFAVQKNESEGQNLLYQGCTVNSGKAIALVTATGNSTVLGKIGKSIEGHHEAKTVLQVQVNRFVRRLALFGLAAFFVILLVNYMHYGDIVVSLLFALTLAMSVAPEEIPVAFSSFMALGAYKMSKYGIISRQPQVIENLGAVTVLCLDKTGTITENKMQVKTIYDYTADILIDHDGSNSLHGSNVLRYAILASESNPFDAMEKAIHEAYYTYSGDHGYENLKMVHEYPLEGQPPMMTHVYEMDNIAVAAAKGAAERVLAVCRLDDQVKSRITSHIKKLAAKGYRVLGVASAAHAEKQFPVNQDDFQWQFEGLLALYDPPKKNIPDVFKKIFAAKVDIKLITGDHPDTAMTIAAQTGIPDPLRFSTGEEMMALDDDALQVRVRTTNVFARMFPEAKLKVINAIKANGDVVAMTGDGVNDGPALKAADIGIAMGKKGTDTARKAADLVLTDDNLDKIVIAVNEGRKIYSNLLKAIRYIISIHIPIILTASLPVILGWRYPNIFTPVHVIFLELIMGPTCSIFFEREPVEKDSLTSGPRNRKAGLFTWDEFLISVLQGVMITAGVLFLYYLFMNRDYSIEETRMAVFTTMILSNVFLTFASRSFTQTIYYTSRYKNILAPFIILISAGFLFLLHYSGPVRQFFQLVPITPGNFWLCFAISFASVMWFEMYKTGLKSNKLL